MKTNTPQKVGFSSDRLKRIDTVIQRHIDQQQLAGVVTMVTRRNEVVHHKKFGWQDISNQTPLELDTIFRIYSMTKPIVCTALMMLHEQGLFQLNDPLTKFIPEFKHTKVMCNDERLVEVEQPLNIRHLLTHTAGLGYGFRYDSPIEEMYRQADLDNPTITLQEMVSRVANIPLMYQPGQSWCYSYATDIVGRLIEILAEMSLADFLEQKIFQALDMSDTAFWVPAPKNGRFAKLYSLAESDEIIKEAAKNISEVYNPEILKLFAGGSGLVSTARDYLQFAKLILNKGHLDGIQLLGRKSVELMTSNHLPAQLMPLSYNGVTNNIVPGFGFGLGMRVTLDPGLTGVMGSVGCHGWGGWANTVFWIDPQEELIGILMTQCITDNVHAIRNDFRTLVYQALVD